MKKHIDKKNIDENNQEDIIKKTEPLEKTANILIDKRKDINDSIEEIYGHINKYKKFTFKITDHCVIQYLRRIELIPVSEARYKILTLLEDWYQQYQPDLDTLKNVYVKVRFGEILYLIQNKTVITVVIDDKLKNIN